MSISSTLSESTILLPPSTSFPRELQQETEKEKKLEIKSKADGLAWQLMLPKQKIEQIDKVIGYIAYGQSAIENQTKSDVCDAFCGRYDGNCGRTCCISRYVFLGLLCAGLVMLILGFVLDSFVLQVVGGGTLILPFFFFLLDGISGLSCAPCTEECPCGCSGCCGCIKLPQRWLSKTATVDEVLAHITPEQKEEIDQLMADLSIQEVENRCCGKTHFSNLSVGELIKLLAGVGVGFIRQAGTRELDHIQITNSQVMNEALPGYKPPVHVAVAPSSPFESYRSREEDSDRSCYFDGR